MLALLAITASPLLLDLVFSPSEIRQAGTPPLQVYRLAAADEQYRIAFQLAIRHPSKVNAMAAAVAANNIGAVAYERHQLDSAEVWFRRALLLDPRHEDALGNLASVLLIRATVQQSADLAIEALALYERALTIAPNRPATLRNAATALELLGRPEQARLGRARADWLDGAVP